jgi:DNA-binding NarL/FixJ family response regulator
VPAKILIIDDSALMREIIQRALAGAGFEASGLEPEEVIPLVDRILEAEPSLVLLDYAMPHCNGLALAQVLFQALPELPVVVLSAQRDPEVLASLGRVGNVRKILQKPTANQVLIDVCRGLCPP